MKLLQLVVRCGALRAHTTQFTPVFYNIRCYSFASAIVSQEDVQAMKTIGTHDGKFHADEALACFMLKQLPVYKDAKIARTRDMSILDKCDVVVDVGGVYDPAKHRYDHHQREFNGTMRTICQLPFDTRLSSAGLIYAHFGKQVIAQLLALDIASPNIDLFFHRLYENFIEEMDGVDNGVEPYDGKKRYKITTTIANRVSNLYPAWNNEAKVNIDVDPSGRIVKFQNGGLPWKEHLFSLESPSKPTILYCLYEDEAKQWRVQCVPEKDASFTSRHPLPKQWQGVRDAELSKVSGIEGASFCHATGFIGGAKTYEAALAMARKACEGYQDAKTNGVGKQ